MDAHAQNDPEALLSDLPVLRRLARALLHDVHAADDLAHDAWIASRRAAPPRTPAARVGWLAAIVRNLASNRLRSERRREAREVEVAGRAVPVTTPADIVRREEVRRLVVEAVLGLPDAQRDVLLMRFWDGMSSETIARHLDLPAATVRSRCKRGLDRVRERLDTSQGRESWAALLLPGVMLKRAWWTRPLVALPALGALGGLGVVLVLLSPWTHDAPRPTLDELAVAPQPASGGLAPRTPNAPDALVPPEALARPAPPDRAGPVYPARRALHTLDVVVLDPDGRPAPGARVELRPALGPRPRTLALHDDRSALAATSTDAAGRVAFEALPDGAWDVLASLGSASGHLRALADDDAGPVVVELSLADDAPPFAVRVVDASGRPEPDAEVEIVGCDGGECRPGLADTPPFVARTNAHGVVLTPLRTGGRLLVTARTDDGRLGMDVALPGSTRTAQVGARVVVAAPGRVAGRLVPPDGVVPGDVTLTLLALTSHAPYEPAVGRRYVAHLDGLQFTCSDLPAGTYSLEYLDPQGTRLDLPAYRRGRKDVPGTVEPLRIGVRAGAITQVDLPLRLGATLAGVVRDADGRPVGGARVLALPVPDDELLGEGRSLLGTPLWSLVDEPVPGELHPAIWRRTTTDADGRYVLAGLPPLRHRVEVEADGLSFERRDGVVLVDGERVELVHALEPDGVLQLVLPADLSTRITLTREGDVRPCVAAFARGPVVTLPGLRPGRYEVTRHLSSAATPLVLAQIEVARGATTSLDLRDALEGDVLLSGQVELPGVALEHARVGLLGEARLDAAGRFRIALSAPIEELRFTPRLSVRLGRRTWSTEVGDDLRGLSRWDGLFLLGDDTLDVETDAGADVRLHIDDGVTSEGRAVDFDGTLSADATGRVDFAGLPAGHGELVTTFPDGHVVRRVVSVPAGRPVRVARLPSGRLVVRVVDADDQPVLGAEVSVTTHALGPGERDPSGDDLGTRTALTNVYGIARLTRVAAGRVTIEARAARARAKTTLDLRRGVEQRVVLRPEKP
ncbi:MAG: sigma-70 family RNA polymerase sigma factor [Planctomycetes bacterium]|nr:sigma-70 family RNA polymerase sigma factor [Planctomycetota bacterium]